MNEVRVARYVVVRIDGEIEEFFSLALKNAGQEPFRLSDKWLTFAATDGPTNAVVSVSDGFSGNPLWEAGQLYSEFVVAVKARGDILPGEQRTVGVHLRRRDRAWVESEEIRIDDPVFLNDVSVLAPLFIEARVIVVFPALEARRLVTATSARLTTTRAAEWSFPFGPNSLVAIRAAWRNGFAPYGLRRVDDVHASLSIAKGRLSVGESIDVESLRKDLKAALGAQSHTLKLLATKGCDENAAEGLDEALDYVGTIRLENPYKDIEI